ncbi:hypothetical protein ACOZK5_34045, partial [Pseudomonas aeruginosa]
TRAALPMLEGAAARGTLRTWRCSAGARQRQLDALSSELQRRRLLALRERTRAALPMLEGAAARGTLRTWRCSAGARQRQLDA